MRIKLKLDNEDPPMIITLAELLEANPFTAEEVTSIKHALDTGHSYHGGGGAAPIWIVWRV